MPGTGDAKLPRWAAWQKTSITVLTLWLAIALSVALWRGLSILSRWGWLASLFALSLLIIASGWYAKSANTSGEMGHKKPTWKVWAALFSASLVWLAIAGQQSLQRLVLLVGLSLASFMVGCMTGFLFTSYGQEKDTIGKVRDWLLGGITGLTIAQASNIKVFLRYFATDDSTREFALVASTAILYVGIGFFFMFLERELILNLWLAQSRAERGRLEGTEQAGHDALRLIQALPASYLTGVHDVSEVIDDKEEEELRKIFDSENMKTFLDEAEEAAKTGVPLDWDVTSKVAYLHYYLTYFAEQKSKESEAELASQWIVRALNLNPLHVDLSVKYADMLELLDRSSEAISILERIEHTPEAPAYVRQWLGCFLLSVEGREDEAIKYSLAYHEQFPDESDTFFNIARAYALKYCHELESNGGIALPKSENRKHALEYLRKGLRAQPDYVEAFKKRWVSESAKNRDWKCLLQDSEFIQLVGGAQPPRRRQLPSPMSSAPMTRRALTGCIGRIP